MEALTQIPWTVAVTLRSRINESAKLLEKKP